MERFRTVRSTVRSRLDQLADRPRMDDDDDTDDDDAGSTNAGSTTRRICPTDVIALRAARAIKAS